MKEVMNREELVGFLADNPSEYENAAEFLRRVLRLLSLGESVTYDTNGVWVKIQEHGYLSGKFLVTLG